MATVDAGQIVYQHLPPARRILRAAVVTETYPPEVNGVAMTIGRMVVGLRQRGHQIQLVRPRQGSEDVATARSNLEEVLQRGIPIPQYDSLRMGLPAKQALLRLWMRRRPDIVHIVTEGPLGWSALSAACKLRIPCSSGFHTNFHSYSTHYGMGWLKKPIAAYLRKFHNKTSATLVPTASLLETLRGQGLNNLRVVARGVDTRLFHPGKRSATLRAQWGVTSEQVVAMYVGRLAPEKNLSLLLDAFAHIRAVHPRTRLIAVGDGPERTALQTACPDLLLAGMRVGEELAAHYASCDLFLFPSLSETFGNVTLEAMASGTAVVAYDYAAAHEHIEHGHNGLLASPGNAAEFVTLAAGLAGDPRRIALLGSRARATAERIDWEHVHQAFESALLDVVSIHESNGRENPQLVA